MEKAKKAARLRIAMENEGALKKTVETRHRPKRRMKPDERLVGSSDSTIMRNVDSKESRKTIERESPAIMSEKIRALSDRLAVPKRQPSTTVHTPILDIVRGVTGERGRFSGIKARGASRQPQQRLVAKMVVAPMGVRFATIAQSEVRTCIASFSGIISRGRLVGFEMAYLFSSCRLYRLCLLPQPTTPIDIDQQAPQKSVTTGGDRSRSTNFSVASQLDTHTRAQTILLD